MSYCGRGRHVKVGGAQAPSAPPVPTPMAYSSTRACFIKKLQELLEDEYEDFESLDKVEKSSYVLGSELWESKFDELLSLVKEYSIDVWEIRKHKLYDSDSGPGQ